MLMKRVRIRKGGLNKTALVAGPFWYIYRGLCAKGLILLLLSIVTLGLGVFPV
jgi:hypothetical protein